MNIKHIKLEIEPDEWELFVQLADIACAHHESKINLEHLMSLLHGIDEAFEDAELTRIIWLKILNSLKPKTTHKGKDGDTNFAT